MGYSGESVRLSQAHRRASVTSATVTRRDWFPSSWPYTEQDFRRADETDDAVMYEKPRLVTHIDDLALGALTRTYQDLFGSARAKLGRPLAVLDSCSSWISHYPQEIVEDGARIAVHGLNEAELLHNTQATELLVRNSNLDPTLPYEDGSFDFVTNVSSVDYLTKPREYFAEVHRVLRPGGVAVVAFSNRCFDTKAVEVWLKHISCGPALSITVENYLHFGAPSGEPWMSITSTDISPRTAESSAARPMGEALGDPMWIVVAVKGDKN